MRKLLSAILLFAAATLSAGDSAAPSFVGDWEFVAVRDGKEDKNWPRTVMTVSADGSCVTRAAGFEVVRGNWRQKGNDVWIADSDGEHRARFDKSGRLKIVTDGKEREFLRGYEFFLRRAKKTAPDAAQLEWEKLIGEKGCLVSASDVKYTLEGSVFAKADWQEFFKAAKNDERIFRFVLSRFPSRKPTDIHICNFRNATEGEVAVFAVQRIVGANWCDYDGYDAELKKITGAEVAAKVQQLKQVVENDRFCASLQRYFFRKYMARRRFDELRAAAEKGDAAAQFELGCRLGFGWGVEGDNRPEAAKWFEKAAVQGHPTARGACLMFGFGVGKDLEQAEKLFRAEAKKGDAWARLLLGMCRLEKRDVREAVRWFRKAALQGNAVAQFHLSERYYFGDGGVAKDPAEAEKWMKKSAEQGFEPALRALEAWKLWKRPPDVKIIRIKTAR